MLHFINNTVTNTLNTKDVYNITLDNQLLLLQQSFCTANAATIS